MRQVLRTFYIPSELDARLAVQAEFQGISKSELIRRYCLAGLTADVAANLSKAIKS